MPERRPVDPTAPPNNGRIPNSIPLPDASEYVREAGGEWKAAHRRLLLALTESCRNVVARKVNEVDGLLNRLRSGLEEQQKLKEEAENDLARLVHAVSTIDRRAPESLTLWRRFARWLRRLFRIGKPEAESADGTTSQIEGEYLDLPNGYKAKLDSCQEEMDRIVAQIQKARSDIEHIRGLWDDGKYLGTVESDLVDFINGISPEKITQEMLEAHRREMGFEHGFPLTSVDSDQLAAAEQAVSRWEEDGRDDFGAACVAARDWIQDRWQCYRRLVVGRSV